jgi:hypothetical protein
MNTFKTVSNEFHAVVFFFLTLIVTRIVKKFPAFMEPEGSLQCSQKSLPLVPTLSQTHPVHTCPPYILKIQSNIIFPHTTPRSSERSLPCRFPNQNFVCISQSLSYAVQSSIHNYKKMSLMMYVPFTTKDQTVIRAVGSVTYVNFKDFLRSCFGKQRMESGKHRHAIRRTWCSMFPLS